MDRHIPISNVEQTRAVLRIRGHVQGVGYRDAACNLAQQLDLAGSIRNLSDGTVEAVAEGSVQAVHQFVSWCHQGPPSAAVREVGVVWGVPHGEEEFRVIG